MVKLVNQFLQVHEMLVLEGVKFNEAWQAFLSFWKYKYCKMKYNSSKC